MKNSIRSGGLMLVLLHASCTSHMETMPSGSGPEDLCVVRVNGSDGVITGTAHRRSAQLGIGDPQGALELHVPGRDIGFRKIYPDRTSARFPFFPTGICTVKGAAGGKNSQLVYVANSSPNQSGTGGSVEVFALTGESARHLGRLGPGDLPVNPNGIAVAPDGTVYVSSFRIFPTFRDVPTIDRNTGARPGTNSIHCFRRDPDSLLKGSWSEVAGGFDGANGLAIDSAGTTLLACSYHSNTIWMIQRNPGTGALTGEPKPLLLDLDFHPDNLKHLGNNRFTICGQKSLAAAVLNLAFNLPVSGGGAIEFTLDKGTPREVAILTEHMKSDRNSPTTAVRAESGFLFGHLVAKRVSKLRGIDGDLPRCPAW